MYGTLYLIPCPISDETAPWDVLPAANRAVMRFARLFHRRKHPFGAALPVEGRIARPIDTLEFRELNEIPSPGVRSKSW